MTRFSAALVVVVALATSTALGVAPRSAIAAEDPELLIQQGNQMRREGDNEGALRVFQRAYNINKTPRAAASLGLCEYALLRVLDAEMHIAEALRARNDAWVVTRRADLKRALDEVRTLLGWLAVAGRPAGAEVEIAGRTVGKLPLKEPIRLSSGEVYLRVSMDGYTSERRTVIVPSGSTAQVVVELEKMAGGGQGGHEPSASDPGSSGPLPPIDIRTSRGGANSWRWPAAWVAGGAAVLLTGAGIWGVATNNSKVSAFDKLTDPMTGLPKCSTGATDAGGGTCPVLLAEANQAKTIATGAFIGAGVAAVLATVFFATAPSAEERLALTPLPACLPNLGPAGASATCSFRF